MRPPGVSDGRHPVEVELTQAVRHHQGRPGGGEAHVADDGGGSLAVAARQVAAPWQLHASDVL